MAEHLILRMGGSPDQAALVELNDEGQLLGGPETTTLSAAAGRAAGKSVTVLLPAPEIVSCLARVPAASPARLRQMLPLNLEDEFAGDVDELHFAAGERNEVDALAVSVIARARLDFWREALKSAGIEPRRICSEADAVPDTPGVVTLFVEGRRILGRRSGGAPFLFEELTLTELWQLLEAEREDAGDLAHVRLYIDPETRREREAEIEAWREGLETLDVTELVDGCLPRLAANLVRQPGPDLLQGDYAPRSSYAALARPWRVAAGFVLAFVALAILGQGAVVFKLGRERDQLLEEIGAVCAQSYSTSQLNGCRLEMLRRLDAAGQTASGGGAGFLAVQAVVAEAAGEALELETMNFRDGVMNLVFLAPSSPYVATFSDAVRESGQYQVIDPRTEKDGDRVRARLQITPVSP